jgi:hypothetical protein
LSVSVCGLYTSISYIEIAVPRNIPNSELILAAPIHPAEEIPTYYSLEGWSEEFFVLNVTRGELNLYTNAQLHDVQNGTSIIKIFGARPLRPQNKI